jgi:hypothetical protein
MDDPMLWKRFEEILKFRQTYVYLFPVDTNDKKSSFLRIRTELDEKG